MLKIDAIQTKDGFYISVCSQIDAYRHDTSVLLQHIFYSKKPLSVSIVP